MDLIRYTKRDFNVSDAVLNFMDFYYAINMKYLASDLLDKGLTPKQISDAVAKAMKIAKSSGIVAKEHFMPVYSGIDHLIIQDCKLSDLGYGLVLINADSNMPVVGEFQVDILKAYLDTYL